MPMHEIPGAEVSYPMKEPNRRYGMFGYESEMLNLAMCFDDVAGLDFFLHIKYPDGRRVFSLESKDFYDRNLLGCAISKGAPLCVEYLYKNGLREGERPLDELMREAAEFRMKRELPKTARVRTWEPEKAAA